MKMKLFMQSVAFKVVYSILYAISCLPMTILYLLASLFFFLGYYLIGYRKEIVIQNIARSFPDKRYGEIQAITKKFYTSFAAYFAEILKSISSPAEILDQKMKFENLELINQYINSGKNVMVSLGHCGNWEMLNFMPYKLQHEMYAVYKPLQVGFMNRLMVRLRSRFGMKLLTDKAVIRHIMSQNTDHSVYLFLADQCPRSTDEKYRFSLLNQETYVFPGMEKLARAGKMAVVYLHITQLSKGNYHITCLPVSSDAASTEEGEVTRKYIELLTNNIVQEPYGWLWTHKRWKR